MDKIKDIIRAEIERRMIQFKKEKDQQGASQIDKLSLGGRIAICEELLAFIDSRPEEKTSQNVEGVVKEYFGEHWPGIETIEQCNTDMHFTPPAIMRLAQHFYELGQQGKIPISKDLEQAADESWTMYEYKDSGNLYSSCYKDGFFAGAQWNRKEMAIKFMHFLDKNRPDGKMCLSNGECADIDKAFADYDFVKIIKYIKKYEE